MTRESELKRFTRRRFLASGLHVVAGAAVTQCLPRRGKPANREKSAARLITKAQGMFLSAVQSPSARIGISRANAWKFYFRRMIASLGLLCEADGCSTAVTQPSYEPVRDVVLASTLTASLGCAVISPFRWRRWRHASAGT